MCIRRLSRYLVKQKLTMSHCNGGKRENIYDKIKTWKTGKDILGKQRYHWSKQWKTIKEELMCSQRDKNKCLVNV